MNISQLSKPELIEMVMELTQENALLKSKLNGISEGSINFGDYIEAWLRRRQSSLQKTTYDGYLSVVTKHIAPYFREKEISLQGLKTSDLEDYYDFKLSRGLCSNTIRRHHANIRKCLSYAQKHELISQNPALLVELPPMQAHTVSYYGKEELLQLLKCSQNSTIYPVILLSSLGLRRSEALGVRWTDIDFNEQTLTVQRKVVPLRGKSINIIDVLKNKSSNRAISIPDFIMEELRIIQRRHERNAELHMKNYNYNYQEYVCINSRGNLINPSYATHSMLDCVRKNGLKNISIKGLRHTCATLISAQGFNLKYVQEWLGHSTITITANTYTHIDMQDKMIVAHSLQQGVFEA